MVTHPDAIRRLALATMALAAVAAFAACGLELLAAAQAPRLDFAVLTPSEGEVVEGPVTFRFETGTDSEVSVRVWTDGGPDEGVEAVRGFLPRDTPVWDPTPRPSGPITLTVTARLTATNAVGERNATVVRTFDWISPPSLGPGSRSWSRVLVCDGPPDAPCRDAEEGEVLYGERVRLGATSVSHPEQITRARLLAAGDTLLDVNVVNVGGGGGEAPFEVDWEILELADGDYPIEVVLDREDGVQSRQVVHLAVANCRGPGPEGWGGTLWHKVGIAFGPDRATYLSAGEGIDRVPLGGLPEVGWRVVPEAELYSRFQTGRLAMREDGVLAVAMHLERLPSMLPKAAWIYLTDTSGGGEGSEDFVTACELDVTPDSHRVIRDLAFAPDGTIWIASPGGLFHCAEGDARRIPLREDRFHYSADALDVDAIGSIVFTGSYDGDYGAWRLTDPFADPPEPVLIAAAAQRVWDFLSLPGGELVVVEQDRAIVHRPRGWLGGLTVPLGRVRDPLRAQLARGQTGVHCTEVFITAHDDLDISIIFE